MSVTGTPSAKPLDLEAMLVRRLDGNRLRVPPYPAVALKLQELAEDEHCTTRQLSHTISADAALVAAVLRRANSAASASSAIITSLEHATTRLGVDQLIRLAPETGIAALLEVDGVSRDERYRIGVMVREIADFMMVRVAPAEASRRVVEIEMLGNVKPCEPAGDGTFAITVQPFGLDGPAKQRWLDVIGRTRPH